MVMRLTPPVVCSVQLVTDIVAERQNGKNAKYFSRIAPEWRQRVQDYIAHAGAPAQVPQWPAIDPKRNSFLNLYLHPTTGSVQGVALAEMRRGHRLNYCPACGEPGAPNTLDHYLPKALYPHFCVTPLNLFPMCDACQDLKGTKTGDAANPRFFIHPYFDMFVANQVIELVVQAPYNTPTFRLSPRDDLTAPQRALVECHVRELDIQNRFDGYFVEQHRRLLRQVDALRRSHQDVQVVLTAFRDGAALAGANVWDHIFYSTTVADKNFMDYLQNGDLPPFL